MLPQPRQREARAHSYEFNGEEVTSPGMRNLLLNELSRFSAPSDSSLCPLGYPLGLRFDKTPTDERAARMRDEIH